MDSAAEQSGGACGIRLCAVTAALALAVVLASGAVATPSAQAQTFRVLHSFSGVGGDGSEPEAALIRDAAGNLYGTTAAGDATGYGTVFSVDLTGKETVLYNFPEPSDGQYPYGSLVRDEAGNFYGTTESGGAYVQGTVFELDAAGKETVLHSFKGGSDGAEPFAALIRDAAGNLYGTTYSGGYTPCGLAPYYSGCGTVFRLSAAGKLTVLHTFTGGGDGELPLAGLVRDETGDLYGTTLYGGIGTLCGNSYGCGTVFKLDKTGTETILYSFTGGADGAIPSGTLIADAAGNLYGATYSGGTGTFCGGGCGTVFKLDAAGTETVLYNFTGGSDGSGPQAGLIQDAAGNLYGTTFWGGDTSCDDGFGLGCGTVFEVFNAGGETVLHSFTGGTHGGFPYAPLIRDAAGNLFGTTYEGGVYGWGTVFAIKP